MSLTKTLKQINMPGKTISDYYATNPADPLDGTEIIPLTQGGQTKGATTQGIADLVVGYPAGTKAEIDALIIVKISRPITAT